MPEQGLMASRESAPNTCGVLLRNVEIVQRRRDGERPRAIARAMGISPHAVAGVLRRAGLTEARDRGQGKPRTAPELRRAVATTPGTLRVVAEKWGVHLSTVWNWRREFRA